MPLVTFWFSFLAECVAECVHIQCVFTYSVLLSVFTYTILLLVSHAYTYFVKQSLVEVEKPQLVELVEGLGVYIPVYNLLSALWAS